MKEQFKGFYNLEEKEFEELWNNGIFIFDTNVLLNLYRYQYDTRDALLKVMEKLTNRVWIPYHVG
ncbi:PIN-like domain-containing protein, partial [Acinetobacter baumannii]|nr:PIN-like domain-containing protein [Acinetobacter baumannii]